MPEIRSFESTLQETYSWLGEISDEMGDPRRPIAYHALRGVLFALRDRLPVDDALALAAQLPMLIRGVFFEGYRASGKPEKFDREAFLERVGKELQAAGGANPVVATRAVLAVLERHLAGGEITKVRAALPRAFSNLWPPAPVNN